MPGTYVENLNLFRKAITLTSADPNDPAVVAATIIDGNQAGTVIDDAGTDTLITGLTITNGGMENTGSNNSPTVTNCIFRNNGTGMSNEACSPTVTNCTFRDNTLYGMLNEFATPTVTNCTFRDNAQGMDNYRSRPSVTNCTFSNNSQGGISNTNHCSPSVTNCIFNGNTANRGGGMYNSVYSNPTVTNCTFSGNSANVGGGMSNYYSSIPIVSNCTFTGNTASQGGGIHNENSSPVITNCEFEGNTTQAGDLGDGGGIYHSGANLTLADCAFNNNISDGGGGGVSLAGEFTYMVTNCTFNGNQSSAAMGAGLQCLDWTGSTSITIQDCIFSNNIIPSESIGELSGALLVLGVDTMTFISTSLCNNQPNGAAIVDVNNVIGYYKAGGICYEEGDIDGDGDVDLVDFALMSENWLAGT
jgi:parallel beta-helix repeat protein